MRLKTDGAVNQRSWGEGWLVLKVSVLREPLGARSPSCASMRIATKRWRISEAAGWKASRSVVIVEAQLGLRGPRGDAVICASPLGRPESVRLKSTGIF